MDITRRFVGSWWSGNYINKCGNCQYELNKDDKYCRKCGTKVGSGKYKPYNVHISCLYGSGMYHNIKIRCKECSYEFEDRTGFRKEINNCPKCGSQYINKIIEEEEKSEFDFNVKNFLSLDYEVTKKDYDKTKFIRIDNMDNQFKLDNPNLVISQLLDIDSHTLNKISNLKNSSITNFIDDVNYITAKQFIITKFNTRILENNLNSGNKVLLAFQYKMEPTVFAKTEKATDCYKYLLAYKLEDNYLYLLDLNKEKLFEYDSFKINIEDSKIIFNESNIIYYNESKIDESNYEYFGTYKVFYNRSCCGNVRELSINSENTLIALKRLIIKDMRFEYLRENTYYIECEDNSIIISIDNDTVKIFKNKYNWGCYRIIEDFIEKLDKIED